MAPPRKPRERKPERPESARRDTDALRASLLAAVPPELTVTFRPMVGGLLGYVRESPFASLSHAGLALRLSSGVGGPDRAALLAVPGAVPLRYAPDSPASRSYVVVPEAMLDDPAQLAPWVERSIGVATIRPRPRRRPRSA